MRCVRRSSWPLAGFLRPATSTEAQWLLILAGNIDQEVDLTFSAIARVLTGVLRAREAARVDIWQQRLAAFADDSRRAPERVLRHLLEALASEVGATSARVTLRTADAERTLVTLGEKPARRAGSPRAAPAGEELGQQVQISPDTSISVALRPSAEGARQAAVELARWTRALQPWLREVVAGGRARPALFDSTPEVSSFESRIQEEVERAKRFNLGLGLVLIGAERGPAGDLALETLLAAIRPELRASDLLGRVRTGLGAVLLVHAEPVGAGIVFDRLRRRLESLAADAPVPVVQLGKAVFSAESGSADALIAQALRQAQSIVLRN
jgi:GGDEF domain-containing protein